MHLPQVIRIFLAISFLGLGLYSYIDKLNALTECRIQIPDLVTDLARLDEENTSLQYQIDEFENPMHLLKLARESEFSHLKYPLIKEVMSLPEGIALRVDSSPDCVNEVNSLTSSSYEFGWPIKLGAGK